MQDIIAMVEKMPDVEGQKLEVSRKDAMQLREDEIKPSVKREELFANAPKILAGCVAVPRTVE